MERLPLFINKAGDDAADDDTRILGNLSATEGAGRRSKARTALEADGTEASEDSMALKFLTSEGEFRKPIQRYRAYSGTVCRHPSTKTFQADTPSVDNSLR